MEGRIIIEFGSKRKNYWKDLWNFRGLFYFLAWRDVLIRYKQAAIGIVWSILRPLFTMLAMGFLGWLFATDVPGHVPRLLLVCAATLPWTFFSSALSEVSGSLLSNSNLLTKVYFPRLIIPASTLIVCLVDFFISLVILFVLMIAFHYAPGWQILALPLFLLLAMVAALGTGMLMAALNVKYRDFKFIVQVIVQFGAYVSPVVFSSDKIYNNPAIPDALKYLYSLNPMVGVIDGFRWCILGGPISIHTGGFVLSVGMSVLMLITGIWYFRKTEKSFADVI
jgi:lipopolysaccharide transport system permease protein